jgi:hypothetical protein
MGKKSLKWMLDSVSSGTAMPFCCRNWPTWSIPVKISKV